ncbi:phosphatidate cytidylyltransferase [Brevibacillus humidisoli]|uniref:phosphatidate cytidylyltransferase n=1 Tax=Brevibacillus humidisoli TaxID=2895522 RepID=UPI001E32772A|nr:phosphatidate cytidylyltransferase [Brevibacillus humidisoli]UFJ42158.1 phosphatidate cytidylyltransferase [Brevibacillus humidisoli]
MKQRIITGVVGGIIFLVPVFLGGIWYSLLVFLLAIIGLYEFLRMARLKPYGFAGLLGYVLMISTLWPYLFYSQRFHIDFSDTLMPVLLLLLFYSVFRKNRFHIEHVALTILGALYIGYGFHYMAAVRGMDDGLWLTLLVLLGIWSTDSGAYFVGRAYGRRKLLPAISPNKTVEGSLGGLLTSLVVVIGLNGLVDKLPFWQAFGIALVTGIAAQIGDLVESAMKRHFGVKDSGKIIPGHGGVLDRFDSLLIVFPILYLLGLF